MAFDIVAALEDGAMYEGVVIGDSAWPRARVPAGAAEDIRMAQEGAEVAARTSSKDRPERMKASAAVPPKSDYPLILETKVGRKRRLF